MGRGFQSGCSVSTTNPATGLEAGTYNVTVANNDGTCPVTATTTVNPLGGPIIFATNINDAYCGNADGSAFIAVGGGIGTYGLCLGKIQQIQGT